MKQDKMKAIVLKGFGGAENFEFTEDITIPKVGPEDVLVKIEATAFNPIDYQMRKGMPESNRIHSPVLGREFSGIVISAGAAVTRFSPGQAVFAGSGSMGSNGTYAAYIVVPESILALKPRNISFQEAAAVPVVYLTALQILDRLPLDPTTSILLTGAAGGVGLSLMKLLIAGGHINLVLTVGNSKSQDVLIANGASASQIVDYHSEDLAQLILTKNQGKLFDVCIDLVGLEMSELCAQVIRVNGSYADVTAFETAKARSDFFDKGATVYHISNYAYSLSGNFKWYGAQLGRIAEMIEKRIITAPPILLFESFSTQSVADAHRILEENNTNGKKIVMNIC
ncbi:NADP-dependent oxidoreductase [Pedobacter polysacchareus]|uniref:NADP-dependent oxidoreductase n=1 Tax=Pedobacter polysacchareus TaxID=2861973 RepID=UPI001C98E817|nr:NADP-dependent oxidoreductase [Pedobacter polysacchareus]